MEPITDKDNRYIDLYGRSLSILHKDRSVLVLLFQDEHYGKIVCTVPYECMLYHNFKRENKYYLQVQLQGKTQVKGYGKIYTKNALIVKSSKII